MRVEVDDPKCVTSGQCVMVAPAVFDQDEEGVVLLLTDRPAVEDEESVHESAAICPAAAIHVFED